MEDNRFVVSCTSMRDLMRVWNRSNHGHSHQFPEIVDFEEVKLRAGLQNGAVDFLGHPDFTFDHLWQFTQRKIVWMSAGLFFIAKGDVGSIADISLWLRFGHPIISVRLPDRSSEGGVNELEVYSHSVTDVTTTVCNSVFQLMTRCGTDWTHLKFNVLSSVATDALTLLLEYPHDDPHDVRNIRFGRQTDLSVFSVDYLHVFQNFAGPHHHLELDIGTQGSWSPQQTQNVSNFFQSGQCAVVLHWYGIFLLPPLFIRDALRGNCNIVDLQLDDVPDIDEELMRAMGSSSSLLRLAFSNGCISEDNWRVLCQSLSTNSTLVYLRLRHTFPDAPADNSIDRKAQRTQVFLEMLQANTVLQELDARGERRDPQDEFDDRFLSDIILPHLRRDNALLFGRADELTLRLIRSNIAPMLVLRARQR